MDTPSDLSFDARVSRLKHIANELRIHVVDMVYTAQSGHIGGSLSAADFVAALYFDLMNVDPANPGWDDRDRFVLSKGHVCPIWYASLAMRGFFPVQELKTLRKNNSRLQGHPIATYLPGLDASAGSLGIGYAQAVGIAMNGKLMKKKDYKVYAVLGDGEINEGIVWESSLAAAKYKLDNLVAIVDYNHFQSYGPTAEVQDLEPLADKWRALGFATVEVDGHDVGALRRVLGRGPLESGRPSAVICHTVKGKGVPPAENNANWHHKNKLKDAELEAVRAALGEF